MHIGEELAGVKRERVSDGTPTLIINEVLRIATSAKRQRRLT